MAWHTSCGLPTSTTHLDSVWSLTSAYVEGVYPSLRDTSKGFFFNLGMIPCLFTIPKTEEKSKYFTVFFMLPKEDRQHTLVEFQGNHHPCIH